MPRNSSMSAPATHTSAFPLRTTAARIDSSRSSRSIRIANSSRTDRANVLTGALGTSSVTTAMPSRTSVVSADVIRGVSSLTFNDHREPHSTGGAHRHEPELSTAASQLVEQRRRYARTRRAERVPDRDRAAHDVQPRTIHLAHRLGEPRALGPGFRLEATK